MKKFENGEIVWLREKQEVFQGRYHSPEGNLHRVIDGRYNILGMNHYEDKNVFMTEEEARADN